MRYPRGIPVVIGGLAFTCILGSAPVASGQATRANEWSEGTMLSGFVGAGRQVGTNTTIGGAIGWELVPHLSLEGRGAWFLVDDGASAFTALLGVRVPLRPARPVVPFLSAGVGLNRVTFDSTGRAPVPDFYRRRMSTAVAPVSHTFDDFAAALAGGADVSLAQHLTLRPELTLLVVKGPSDRVVVPSLVVHLAYHFENRFVTP